MNRSLKSVCSPFPQLSNLRSDVCFFSLSLNKVVVVAVFVVYWTAGMGKITSTVVCLKFRFWTLFWMVAKQKRLQAVFLIDCAMGNLTAAGAISTQSGGRGNDLRVHRSHNTLRWFPCGSIIMVEMESGVLVFLERGKPENPKP